MITKQALIEYNDLCAEVEDTERQLRRLIAAQNEVLHDSVKGSNPEYPYEPITFHISGIATNFTSSDIERMKRILMERREAVKAKRFDVETWINTIPVRMQRIVRLKFIEGLSWTDVAMRTGKNISGDGVRKEFWRFFEEWG